MRGLDIWPGAAMPTWEGSEQTGRHPQTAAGPRPRASPFPRARKETLLLELAQQSLRSFHSRGRGLELASRPNGGGQPQCSHQTCANNSPKTIYGM